MKNSNVFNAAPNEASVSKIANHRKVEVFRARVTNAHDYSVVKEEFKYWNEHFKGLENVEVTLIEDPIKSHAPNVLMQCYKEDFASKVKEGNYKDYLNVMSIRDCFIVVTIFEE